MKNSKTLLKKVVITLNQEEFAYDDANLTELKVVVNGIEIPFSLDAEEYCKAQGQLNDGENALFYKTADDKSADLMSVVSDSLRDNYDFYSSDTDGFEFIIINCDDRVIAMTTPNGVFSGWEALSEAQDVLNICEEEEKHSEALVNSQANTKNVIVFIEFDPIRHNLILSVIVDNLPIVFVPNDTEIQHIMINRHNKLRTEWAIMFTLTRFVKKYLDMKFPEEFQPEGRFERFAIELITKPFILKNKKVAINTNAEGFITQVFVDDAPSQCSLDEWCSAQEYKRLFNLSNSQIKIESDYNDRENSYVRGV